MTPKRGARWAEAGGRESVCAFAERSKAEKFFKTFNVSAEASVDGGIAEKNARSQIDNSARPWATEARRPTVHMMAASSASSRSRRRSGLRCPARTKGRVAEAWEERERVMNVVKEGGRLCAR